MTAWTLGRGAIYLLGLAAGGLALAGYATFDAETWMLDISPFDLKKFVLTIAATVGNGVAALAVWKKWGRK